MCDTMEKLRDTPLDKFSPLANILLGQWTPTKVDKMEEIKFIDETLNDSQKDAVRFSLSTPEIALIHGPPGVILSIVILLTVDWKNIYPHRNNPPINFIAISPVHPRCRPFQHLSRQSLRTSSSPRYPPRSSRSSSPSPPVHSLALPRRPYKILRPRCSSPRCPFRSRQGSLANQKDTLGTRTERYI